jgi:hypothetical protein
LVLDFGLNATSIALEAWKIVAHDESVPRRLSNFDLTHINFAFASGTASFGDVEFATPKNFAMFENMNLRLE